MNDRPVVYVVDDDLAVREVTRRAIEPMQFEVRCFASGQEFFDGYDAARLGCLVTDLHMPEMSGQRILETLDERRIGIPAIMISGDGDIPAAVRALNFGAIEFLEKPYPLELLREAVRKAVQLAEERRGKAVREAEFNERLATLTPDELSTMQMIVDGKPDKAIAARLDVSVRTVQFRRASLMKKLRVRTRVELIRVTSSAAEELTLAH